MKLAAAGMLLFGPILITAVGLTLTIESAPERAVAFTVDDLPAGASNFMTASEITTMTAGIVGTLKQEGIPAVGFVNSKKLFTKVGEVDERIKALQMWLDAGFELGNHTWSHMSLNRAILRDWEDDVVQGEPVLKMLLAQHDLSLRYFRYPYLDTGRDVKTAREAEGFLSQRGYRIAPVTLDAWDWLFARVYDDAKKRGDRANEKQIVTAYLQYSNDLFDYDEKLSMRVVGYEPKQIILLHGNNLEAEHIGELADVFRKRGYKFITLEEALNDQAYSLPDTYLGNGRGMLQRWAITQGHPATGEPQFPPAILERGRALYRPE
jgi:peptidoglycan-N-acetylglucosamine deacetylase